MEVLAQTRVRVWEGFSLWMIDAVPEALRARQWTDMHAHHAIQVTIGIGGQFRVETASGAAAETACAVAPDAPHCFAAEGLVAHLFIEPESRDGRSIRKNLLGGEPMGLLPEEAVGEFCEGITRALANAAPDEAWGGAVRGLIERLAGNRPYVAQDWRVRRMIEHAASNLANPVSLGELVPVCGLSVSRLSHLFVEQTGLPFRSYLLWLRLTRAVSAAADGLSLTEAAHEAGFADSAHLSRTFRRMFGVPAASIRIS